MQVNGKLRDTIKVVQDADSSLLESKAMASETIKKWIAGKEIVKIITIPNRIVNIVIK